MTEQTITYIINAIGGGIIGWVVSDLAIKQFGNFSTGYWITLGLMIVAVMMVGA